MIALLDFRAISLNTVMKRCWDWHSLWTRSGRSFWVSHNQINIVKQILIIKLQKQLKMFYEGKSVRCQKKKQKLRYHASKQSCGHPQRSVPTLWWIHCGANTVGSTANEVGSHCQSQGKEYDAQSCLKPLCGCCVIMKWRYPRRSPLRH